MACVATTQVAFGENCSNTVAKCGVGKWLYWIYDSYLA